jgi:hypothetical protein
VAWGGRGARGTSQPFSSQCCPSIEKQPLSIQECTDVSEKKILKELKQSFETNGGDHFTRPGTIRGFTQEPDNDQKAVNELLSARLLEGHKDDEGNMVVAINTARLPEVKKELRPI